MPSERLHHWRVARARQRAARRAASPKFPAIAEKADDLEAIKKAVEDAASISGGLWLSYLFVLFYIAVAAGAVTHVDLLLQRPVKLPFLNIELPLLGFFALAPPLFVVTHAYALLHFIMLGKKAAYFHEELRRQIPDSQGSAAKDIRDKLRRLLPSNIFVQILAGPPELRKGAFGFLLKLMAWTTLVLFPVLLLLLLQIRFLPYHHLGITWLQRLMLCLDIALLWVFPPPIFTSGEGIDKGFWHLSREYEREVLKAIANADYTGTTFVTRLMMMRKIRIEVNNQAPFTHLKWWGLAFAGGACFSGLAVIFSIGAFTIPGEWQGISSPEPGVNVLLLPGFDIYRELRIDDPKKVEWKKSLLDLRERHLEYAFLQGADLTKADLSSAWLQGASLDYATLQGASLYSAQLQGASLKATQLQGALLASAELQGADLEGAHLQGALLYEAQLRGASLMNAELQGASLERARLQGTVLEEAKLQGAVLKKANLKGALLEDAELQGASLKDAQLQGASLEGARTEATDFSGAFLWRLIIQAEEPLRLAAIDGEKPNWEPVWISESKNSWDRKPWTQKNYINLLSQMEKLPKGKLRDDAIERIKILDCDHPDKTLASCDATASAPEGRIEAQKLQIVRIDDQTHRKALASILRELVCTNDANSIYILRGLLEFRFKYWVSPENRFEGTGAETPALIDSILSRDCPLAASLTDKDKESLLQVKQHAQQKFPPPSEAQKSEAQKQE